MLARWHRPKRKLSTFAQQLVIQLEPVNQDLILPLNMIRGGFVYLIGWFVGGTSCTLQTLYAWLMRGFGILYG